jgi:hypothetical protein
MDTTARSARRATSNAGSPYRPARLGHGATSCTVGLLVAALLTTRWAGSARKSRSTTGRERAVHPLPAVCSSLPRSR